MQTPRASWKAAVASLREGKSRLRWRSGAVPIAALLLLPSNEPRPSRPATGSIEGVVLNCLTGAPLPAARVSLAGSAIGSLTSATGQFRLDNVPAGTHTLRIDAVGVSRVVRSGVVVTDGAVTSASIVLNPDPTITLVVNAPSTSLEVGTSMRLTANVRYCAAITLTDVVAEWESDDPLTIEARATGQVSALREGSAVITATSEGQSSSVTITVPAPPVHRVAVAPSTAHIVVGDDIQLAATVFDVLDNVLTGRTLTWTALGTAVSVTPAGGLVTGLNAGSGTVLAVSEGQTGSADIEVLPPAATAITIFPSEARIGVNARTQFTAIVLGAGNVPLSNQSVTWNVLNAATASIDPGTGLVTGNATGTTTVWAAQGSVSSPTATVTVASSAVDRVRLYGNDPDDPASPVIPETALLLRGTFAGSTHCWMLRWTGDGANTVVDVAAGAVEFTFPAGVHEPQVPCASATASVFSANDAAVFTPNVGVWSNAPGDLLALDLARGHTPVRTTVWLTDNAYKAVAQSDVGTANLLLHHNRTGIKLLGGAVGALDPPDIVNASAHEVAIGGSCNDALRFPPTAAWYDPDRVNVYYVAALTTGALLEPVGYNCEDHGLPNVIYIDADNRGNETLAHEVAHGLGLLEPSAGHTSELDDRFTDSNIMWTGVTGRSTFSVGQAFRMNFHAASWLPSSSESSALLAPHAQVCKCDPDATEPCPLSAIDRSTPSASPFTNAVICLIQITRYEDPAVISSVRLASCDSEQITVRSYRDASTPVKPGYATIRLEDASVITVSSPSVGSDGWQMYQLTAIGNGQTVLWAYHGGPRAKLTVEVESCP